MILSQLIGALLRRIGQAGPDDRSAAVFAEGMALATDAAYAAVGRPVEGTILSVARAAADAAAEARRRSRRPAGRRRARRGRCGPRGPGADPRPAAAARRRRRGRRRRARAVRDPRRGRVGRHRQARHPGDAPRRHPAIPVARVPTGDLTEDGPAYEVMYLLEADDEAIPACARQLAPLGDSLVVVGGDGLWNVHVHVDDVGAAIEAGIRAGSPRRIAVTHFAEQLERAREKRRASGAGRRLVVVAAGPGLAELFASTGAEVIHGGPGSPAEHRRDPRGDRGHRRERGDRAAQRPRLHRRRRGRAPGRRSKGIHVVVIPTRAQVQGIAALAVHEPGRPLDSDVVQMATAARGARHGAVTVAARDAMTTAGPCAAGDVLGVVQGTSRSSATTCSGGGRRARAAARRWRRAGHPGRRRRLRRPRRGTARSG